jgi:hypothetical protein
MIKRISLAVLLVAGCVLALAQTGQAPTPTGFGVVTDFKICARYPDGSLVTQSPTGAFIVPPGATIQFGIVDNQTGACVISAPANTQLVLRRKSESAGPS